MDLDFGIIMRLWTIHPKYLDSKGLVALWREALLAQKVLKGETKGYKFHPQLDRFKSSEDPSSAISFYLSHVLKESESRGYNFDKSKINKFEEPNKIEIDQDLISSEFEHLKSKLKIRDQKKYKELLKVSNIELHPLFTYSKARLIN